VGFTYLLPHRLWNVSIAPKSSKRFSRVIFNCKMCQKTQPGEAHTPSRKPQQKEMLMMNKSTKKVKKAGSEKVESASRLIDERIQDLTDWRGEMLSRLRGVIHQADPEVVEEWKWGIPVWSHDGLICTGETYKSVVKMTFAKGASLDDPARLFNSSLEGRVRRAIDFRQGEKINEKALKTLIRAAVAFNCSLASLR